MDNSSSIQHENGGTLGEYSTVKTAEVNGKIEANLSKKVDIVCKLQHKHATKTGPGGQISKKLKEKLLIELLIREDLITQEDVTEFRRSLNHLFSTALPKCGYNPKQKKIPIYVKVHADRYKASTSAPFSWNRTKMIFQMAASFCTSEFSEQVIRIECFLKSQIISGCVTTLLKLTGRGLCQKVICRKR
jgi:hypothetical protein